MAIEFLKIDPPKMMGQIPLPFEVIPLSLLDLPTLLQL
jgi:hypothetical protein